MEAEGSRQFYFGVCRTRAGSRRSNCNSLAREPRALNDRLEPGSLVFGLLLFTDLLEPVKFKRPDGYACAVKAHARAYEWYQKAADNGNAAAMGNLGWLYLSGLGTERNYVEARHWFERAAGLGNVKAMTNLGWLYENGLGVAQDLAEARRWYQKAAESGDSDAKKALSRLPSG